MTKVFLWFGAAALGFGLMLWAYNGRPRLDPTAPWAFGFIAVGSDKPEAVPPPVPVVPARLRLLPATEQTELLIQSWKKARPEGSLGLELKLRPKLVLLPEGEARLEARQLRTGRLPLATDEVLAGAAASRQETLRVGARTLKVVGVLDPSVALFADSFVVLDRGSSSALFPAKDSSVHQAALVRLTREQAKDRTLLRNLETALPSSKFTKYTPSVRLDRQTFYRYLGGQFLFLIGGSGLLIALYRALAGRIGLAWFNAPFQEMRQRPVLLWAVHWVYFGLVMVGSIIIYELPDLQSVLLTAIQSEIGGSKGPLGFAGKAYGSGNIAWAAAVTFLINFLLGSIVCITLPSMVVPALGVGIAVVRAMVWGLLLAPTFVTLAGPMLPHTGTMLLEGEGYILAAFFGLLIPVHLAQRSLGGTTLNRYGRVLLLNIQANALVALVLAVAACYEATEVILMAR